MKHRLVLTVGVEGSKIGNNGWCRLKQRLVITVGAEGSKDW